MRSLAWSLVAVLASLSALHVYWASGGHRGASSAVPELDGKPLFRPGIVSTLVVAFLLALAAVLILERATGRPRIFPRRVSLWGTWVVAGTFTVRALGDFNTIGAFKRRRDTRFARLDTKFYTPLALALGMGAGIIAWVGG